MDCEASNKKWAIAIDHLTKHLVHGYIRQIQHTLCSNLNINIIPIDIAYIISIYHFEEKRQKYRIKNEIVELFEYYQPKRRLANGRSDFIFEAIDKRTNKTKQKKVAIKKFKYIFSNRDKDIQLLLRELKLLLHFTKYRHPDIMRIRDMIPPTNIKKFDNIYVVMPFRDVNLFKVITSKQKINALHYKYITYQILRGLKFMHECNIIHRDIRPENIMIRASDCDVRIINFGMSNIMQIHSAQTDSPKFDERWYKSPEYLGNGNKMELNNNKLDSWGVGCILFEMILKKPIFTGSNYLDQFNQIYNILGTPEINNLQWIKSTECRVWHETLDMRPKKDIKEMISSKFTEEERQDLLNCVDLLEKLLCINPAERISVGDALRLPFFDFVRDVEDDHIKEIRGKPFDLSYERDKPETENNDNWEQYYRKMIYYTMIEFHHRDWEKKIDRKKRKMKRKQKRGHVRNSQQ